MQVAAEGSGHRTGAAEVDDEPEIAVPVRLEGFASQGAGEGDPLPWACWTVDGVTASVPLHCSGKALGP